MTKNSEGGNPEDAAEKEPLPSARAPISQPNPVQGMQNIEPVAATSHSQGQLEEEQRDLRRQVQSIDRLQSYFNGGLLLVGVLEIFILIFQTCLFRRQNGIMDTQNTIMSATNEIMEKQVHVENRPWLRVASVTITKLQEGQRVFFDLELSVSGHVPAKIRSVTVDSFPITQKSDVPALVNAKQKAAGTVFSTDIPPDVPVRREHRSMVATKERLAHFTSRKMGLWVVGRIEYTDISANESDAPNVTYFAFANDPLKAMEVGDHLELQLEYSRMD